MTGAELGPAAMAAAGNLFHQTKAERDADSAAVRDAARESSEIAAAGTIRAKRMVLKEHLLLKLWQPLAKFAGVSSDYFAADFAKDMAAKLEGVPEESLQTPKISVAAPAFEALGYSLDEPDLKDMYLNLLAGATTRDRADLVHPSFVDAIRHISAEEAPLLNQVLRHAEVIPLIEVQLSTGGEGHRVLFSDVLNPDFTVLALGKRERIPAWIANWERLGLVSKTYNQWLVDQSDHKPYAWADTCPEMVHSQRELEGTAFPNADSPAKVEFSRGILKRSPLGADFFQAVSQPDISRPRASQIEDEPNRQTDN